MCWTGVLLSGVWVNVLVPCSQLVKQMLLVSKGSWEMHGVKVGRNLGTHGGGSEGMWHCHGRLIGYSGECVRIVICLESRGRRS